jgi:hypothetical protein
MKAYIYTMFAGADPGQGWEMNDPIFDNPPTLGACMPQIRRNVEQNDHIFTISGRTSGVKQYLVGGFQVQEKIDAMLARDRFPQYRQRLKEDGSISGNIIVDSEGKQNKFDYHEGNFQKRIENYIIGKNPIYFTKQKEIEAARGKETMKILREVFKMKGGSIPFDIIGRWRKMDENQIELLTSWIRDIKRG